MPGPLLHVGATVLCAHGGQAQPSTPYPRVQVMGQPIVLQTSPYIIAGCPFPPPPTANGPCVTAQWLTGSTRVLANGMPILLLSSQAICAPTGTPLIPSMVQTRVIGI
jgi:hypothetical protein